MDDAIGHAEAMLGLDGFRVLDVDRKPAEMTVTVETTAEVAGCPTCGVRAKLRTDSGSTSEIYRVSERTVRLVWMKRRWRCVDPDCSGKDLDRGHRARGAPSRADVASRGGGHPPRRRTGHAGGGRRPRACRVLVDGDGRGGPHGTPLVDDPKRVGKVKALGIDETSFLSANRERSTVYATGMVDLERRKIIDMVEGNGASELRRWCVAQDPAWLAGVRLVATDLAESYRAGTAPHLDHAIRVADPFHVVRVANRCVDKVRRRVQNETLGHRGRKHDPLYRIRKLFLKGTERLDQRGHDRLLLGLRIGDPHDELLGAWLAKEWVRDVYLTDDPRDAAVLLQKAITACRSDDVQEIRSLGDTLQRWQKGLRTTIGPVRRTVPPRARTSA